MDIEKSVTLLPNRTVWVMQTPNRFDGDYTLLISKVSEAILPNTVGNHVGEGASMDIFLEHQKDTRFIINGGFSHYRKDFYDWTHNTFHVGDPVGVVKIREHLFEDVAEHTHYGFFVQEDKYLPWSIVTHTQLNKKHKYILGCTPLLIYNNEVCDLSACVMEPMKHGVVNPPSYLGHGKQRHPRTAVGVRGGDLVFVLVEGTNEGGCTLEELQDIGVQLGLEQFLNLDGGGSSQFRYWDGETWMGNAVDEKDQHRVLGHVLVLFDQQLRPKTNDL